MPLLPSPPALSVPVRAALYMVASCFIGSIAATSVRYVGSEIHGFEIAFFRAVIGAVVLLPFLFRSGIPTLPSRKVAWYYATRGVVSGMSFIAWFYALTVISVADVTALSFTTPIFATVLAIVLLHEVVGIRRWTATIVGFLGAMLVLRPAPDALEWGAVAALVSAMAGALNIIFIKVLSRTERSEQIVAYQSVMLIPITLVPALFVWTWPTLEALGWLVVIAVFGTASNWCTVRAFSLGEASAVLPFDFIRLPFVALFGYIAFAETPDLWTWVGGVVIFASTVYIARREAALRRNVTTPAPGEPPHQ